ncbi:hypothetical protein PoB_004251000 [Plakobranchus ocellatus]|uniref:ENTH domain-containing protein n=1 Tax=Plakobranchus ocellatus TaxID=259542 RepID=A0AAV4BA82_9GAST|nr:hypothetical protein PoB_004251000 [Plakobranchus ocellatus]
MWRILLRQMEEQSDAATKVIKAIIVLHNFILMQEPERSVAQHTDNDVAEPRVSRSRATKSASKTCFDCASVKRWRGVGFHSARDLKAPGRVDADASPTRSRSIFLTPLDFIYKQIVNSARVEAARRRRRR